MRLINQNRTLDVMYEKVVLTRNFGTIVVETDSGLKSLMAQYSSETKAIEVMKNVAEAYNKLNKAEFDIMSAPKALNFVFEFPKDEDVSA